MARGRKRQTTPEQDAKETTPVTGGKVSDELFMQAYSECKNLEAAYQEKREEASEAQGEYRARLKHFKKLGVNIDMVVQQIKDSKREPEDVRKDLEDLIRLKKLLGLPIGTQIDIFGETMAAAKPIDEVTVEEAKENGYAAARNGLGRDENMYAASGVVALIDAWNAGWDDCATKALAGKETIIDQKKRPRGNGRRSTAAAEAGAALN